MLRTLIVVGLAALFIGLTMPNLWLVGAPIPFATDESFTVNAVVPGAEADAIGVHLGDRIDMRPLSYIERMEITSSYRPAGAAVIPFTVVREGRRIRLEVPAVAGFTASTATVALVKRSTATIFVIFAAILLLLRPNKALWGLFLFALGSVGGDPFVLGLVNGTLFAFVMVGFETAYFVLAAWGLLWFATSFPVRSTSGWRCNVERMSPALIAVVAIASIFPIPGLLAVPLPVGSGTVALAVDSAVEAIALSALLAGFFQLDAAQRQRLRWVVAAFAVYYATFVYLFFSSYLPGRGWPAAWSNAGVTEDVLISVQIVIPIAVAYTAFKHHVLDINFVIGRGLVYGIITSIAVAVLAIVDWFVGGVLAQTKLAATGEVIAAVAIGFWINALHKRVDGFVDAVIFRRRHLAEKRLAQVAAGLPHASSEAAVSRLLVREPVEALGLLSAAFFRRHPGAVYRCELEIGVPSYQGAAIGADDVLAVHLHGARGPVFLHQINWTLAGAHAETVAPVVALPVFVRDQVDGIALYGGHETGEAIDPDEIRAITALCVAAAAALDHLEAEDLRSQLDEAKRIIVSLGGIAAAAT